jgi:hypothetical protein
VITLLLLVWITAWLMKEEPGLAGRKEPRVKRQSSGSFEVVLQDLEARQVTSATAPAVLRAETTILTQGWRVLYLQNVEIDIPRMENLAAGGDIGQMTGPASLRGDQGWVDMRRFNVLLAGDVLGRGGQGREIAASRLEYEPAKDEIRFVTATLRGRGYEDYAPVIVTDSQLDRIEFGREYDAGSRFFQKALKGRFE